jgi:holo-[acyl-carrier protein] synthase
MAKGLGTDIIEIGRIEKVITRYGQKFLDRIFTQKEQEYCSKHKMSARHYAGRFAAKEAIAKALGTGISKDIGWTDIEIVNDSQGKPHVKFSSRIIDNFDDPQCLLSISHCKEYASAVAILE